MSPHSIAVYSLNRMRWTVHGERHIYTSDWVSVSLVDVEVPDGERFEHHVIRHPRHAAGTVVHHPDRGVLLLWRHRFITDTWGWEIPAGGIEPDETAIAAAERETVEETGWRPHSLRAVGAYAPSNGISDQEFHIFVANDATYEAEPTDPAESSRIEWVPTDEVRKLVADGAVHDGLSLTGLLWSLAWP